MKRDLSLWLRRWQLPLLLLLSVMPLMLMQISIDAPDALGALGVLSAAFALVSGACLLAPGSRRLPAAVLGSAVMLAMSIALLPIHALPSLLLLPGGLIVLLLVSLPLAMRQYESEIPPFVYVCGILVHVVVQFLHHYFEISGGESPYAPIDSALTASLVGYVLLLLLSMNRISLDNATLARHRLPASMRRFNTALTLAFAALSLALAALPAVVRAVQALGRALAEAAARLGAWLLSLLPAAADYGGSAPADVSGLPELAAEASEPGMLAQIMEKIASVLALLLLAVGGLFLLYLIIRQLRRFVRFLLARAKQYVTAASSDYDDEITDTREDGAQREAGFTRRARRRAPAHDNTPAGRIRHAYARLLHRNPKWAASSTARENLPKEAAALYERSRYSDHPVTGEDAERFAAEIKKA